MDRPEASCVQPSTKVRISIAWILVAAVVLIAVPGGGAASSPGWSTPFVISSTSTSNSDPSLVVDSGGNPHVVWVGNDGSTSRIYYAKRTGGSWSAPVIVSINSIDNDQPSIALDGSGNPHVVWKDHDGLNTHIYYSARTTGAWYTPVVISGSLTGNSYPDLAVDSGNEPHAVWSGDDTGTIRAYYSSNPGGGWTTPKYISGTYTENYNVRLALNASGSPHAVWEGSDGATSHILFNEKALKNWLTTPTLLSTGGLTQNRLPKLALDANGNPNVTWYGSDGLTNRVYFANNTGGGWSGPFNVSPTTTNSQVPRIALDPDARSHITWTGEDGATDRIYYSNNTTGGWPVSPTMLSTTSTLNLTSNIAVDASGNPRAAWSGSDGATRRVYYSARSGGTWSTPLNVSSTATDNLDPGLTLDPWGNPHLAWTGSDGATRRVYYASDSSYPVTASVSGGNGTVSPASQRIASGGTATVTITPYAGYHTASVKDNGVTVSPTPSSSYRISNVVTSHNVVVTFERDPSTTCYLAEGSTAWGYDCYISIQNPNSSAANVSLTYQTVSGPRAGPNLSMPPNSQATVNPRDTLGDTDFSTRVQCTNGKTIAADRTMSWNGGGSGAPGAGGGPEGHCAVAVGAPAKTWYLPEGSSAWGFECYLLIQNPGTVEAECTVTYMLEGEGPVAVKVAVAPASRGTWNIADHIGSKDASIKVESDQPVIPERAMYRYARREGHDSIGTTAPASDYYLAEGAVGYDAGYVTYVLVQNPNSQSADVSLSYMTGTGKVAGPSFNMPGNSRKTVRVDLPPNSDVSTTVHGSRPIIAERAMYWTSPAGEACHDSIGMSSAHTTFYLPDGQTSGGRETWTLVQNPNASTVTVEICYMTPDGAGNVVKTETIPAGSRKSFNMAQHSGLDGRAAIKITCKTSGRKIMCERAMYWESKDAGTDTIGSFWD